MRAAACSLGLVLAFLPPVGDAGERLPGTKPLTESHQVASIVRQQLGQVIRYFQGRVAEASRLRERMWRPDFASAIAYERSLSSHRAACRRMLGLADAEPQVGKARSVPVVTAGTAWRADRVTIPISAGLSARGLLIVPLARPAERDAAVIVCPDAESWPERFTGLETGGPGPAGWLAELVASGAMVYVPQSIERLQDHPYCETTNHKDRRLILHRLGYPVGRSMTGLDVQDVLAGAAYLASRADVDPARVGLVGIGQGGMTALFAAALDRRVRTVVVADYFQSHQRCQEEPADRRLPGRLVVAGDAELAALIAPRPLAVVCSSLFPVARNAVTAEFDRAQRFFRGLGVADRLRLQTDVAEEKLAEVAVKLACESLGLAGGRGQAGVLAGRVSAEQALAVRNRHFEERLKYLRTLIAGSERRRQKLWGLTARPPEQFPQIKAAMLEEYRRLVGHVPTEGTPLDPRTELALATDKYKLFRVMLDVTEGVELYGHLLVPQGIDGRMPAVIAQHGLNGTPEMISGLGQRAETPYHQFGRHLAEHGYVVFAPLIVHHHPVKQVNDQVVLAEAAGMMRVAMVVAKTERAIDFLQSLPFVDGERIGYYGLSYGGYSALWVGPLVERLKVIIPSGHFNDWGSKITADYTPTSYLRHPDEDFYNWAVLERFTHPELIAMMLPRPVCIEFGQRDGITTPQWTAYAWRQATGIAAHLGLTDRLELAHYDGVHEVHGVETFDFLDRFLRPERPVGRDGDGRGLVEHVLDGRWQTRVTGRFWIPAGACRFRGMAIRVSRRGRPGPMHVRFGSAPGRRDLGEATAAADDVSEDRADWCLLRLGPQPVRPGQLVYFELTSEGGRTPADHYIIYGPRPLGGTHWATHFALCYRVLTEPRD